MQIVLLRHGMSEIYTDHKMSAHEYGRWVREYNRAGIDLSFAPPVDAVDMAQQCDFVVCSDLPRSLESARALGIRHIDVTDSLFREFEIPYAHRPWPKLSASSWTVLFRLLWLLGYSRNSETFAEAKGRARLCMSRLLEYAQQSGTVLFVGHGSLLWYLDSLLRQSGWQSESLSPRRHWQYGHYFMS